MIAKNGEKLSKFVEVTAKILSVLFSGTRYVQICFYICLLVYACIMVFISCRARKVW